MDLRTELAAVDARSPDEARALDTARRLVASGEPWSRAQPVHVTGSALVVHPPSERVLLRWHERLGSWLHVGGHGDPGERSALAVARREAAEETGLTDLTSWPGDPVPLHVALVDVPAGKGEPAHHHLDVIYVLATATPDAVVAESAAAPLRWVPIATAAGEVASASLARSLERLAALVSAARAEGGTPPAW